MNLDPRLNLASWRRLRVYVLDRDRWLCQVKGPSCTKAGTCVDHVVARADDGAFWDPANLRASCRACNSRGGAEVGNRRAARYRNTVAEYVTRL